MPFNYQAFLLWQFSDVAEYVTLKWEEGVTTVNIYLHINWLF